MRALLNRSVFRNFSTHLLKNARVVNSDISFNSDVLIEDGKIASVSPNISHKSAQVIDCTGKLVIPGGIDTHTHMQLPFMGTFAKDDFDTGSKAAIAGGTTSFIDFVIPGKGTPLREAYQTWRGWADPKVNCDYSLHAAITDWTDETPSDMKRMVENGITSFKFFMAYNNVLRLDDVSMYKAFEVARDLGALCIVHAQNGDIIEMNQQRLIEKGITGPQGHYLSRKQSVEAQAVHRVITFAENTNVPLYIVHLMSKESTEEVMRARNRGLLVYGQTLAATLGTDGTKLWDKDWDVASRYVMSPCLSPDPKTKTQIMKYLSSGIIDVVSTDNCTFCTEQKQLGRQGFNKIPNGVNGVQDRLSVVWTKGVVEGLLTENQFVEKTSTNAAQIFGMYPNKGVIREGADADIAIFDPNFKKIISAKTHHHSIDYNVFEGMEVYGKTTHTFSNGNLVWDGKNFLNQKKGKFVERKPFGFPYRRHAAWTKLNDPLNFKVDRSGAKEKKSAESSEVEKLQVELADLKAKNVELSNKLNSQQKEEDKYFDGRQLIDTYEALEDNLPPKMFESIRNIIYGPKTPATPLQAETVNRANKLDVQVKSYKINCEKEQTRDSRIVKVAAIQNKIVIPASRPVAEQKKALENRIKDIIELAALEKANVVCMQELWTAPFFLCTREKYPWVEFSEPIDGQSTQLLQELAKKHNMVIVSSILERENKGTVQNTTVVVDNHGNLLGKQEKGHIPRVGDFNESTYYIEGESGHPVFSTDFGKIGINICYGRHHPLHWMGFGLNGAEIVFNPSATVDGLSEPLWGIEARNAAIANHYFSVGINRVGTEVFPNEFTSANGKKAHNDFGHFYGSTYVAAPDGSRTPSLSRTRDGLLLTELDLNMCQQIKDKWCFTMTARHKLYADLLTKFSSANYVPQEVSIKNPQK